MEVRCPQCHSSIALSSDSALGSISCPSCGCAFSLLGTEETDVWEEGRRTVGHFTLQKHLGTGSFGTVWQAHDVELDRTVAVKIPLRGSLTADEAEQFLREARAAAQLRHPHIVSVFEVGRDEDTLFIVSEFVPGITLEDWLTARRPNFRESAKLCAQIADGLHHAHECGVIHRDLKPGNVILDAECQPHLTDFGLALREAGEITMTVDGKVLGTPAYMSPEQATDSHHVDRRADVYSLGVILFRLLTGELPFRGNVRMLMYQVVNDPPPSLRSLNNRIPRDLETICLHCLEKDPGKRYDTAQALAADLRHYLDGRPIEARPVSSVARAWRWCKRNAMLSALSAVLFVTLTCGLIGAVWVAAVVARRAEATRYQLYLSDMGRAQNAAEHNNYPQVRRLLEVHADPGGQRDLRRFEWYYLDNLCRDHDAIERFSTPSYAFAVAVSPEGTEVAVGMINNGVLVHNLQDQQDVAFGPQNRPYLMTAVAYSPDGKYLAHSDGGTIHWRPRTDGPPMRSDGHRIQIAELTFSPDGSVLLSAGADGSARLWSAATGKQVGRFDHGTSLCSAAWSSTGQSFAIGDDVGYIIVVDRETLASAGRWKGHDNRVESLAFSPDDAYLVSGSDDRTVALWNWHTGTQMHRLSTFADAVRAVRFLEDGKCLATAARDGKVRLWQMPAVAERADIPAHSSAVVALDVSPDKRTLVTGGHDFSVGVIPLPVPSEANVLDCGHVVANMAFSPDSSLLVFAARSKDNKPLPECAVVQVASATVVTRFQLQGLARSLAYGATGVVAIGLTDGHVELWDPTRPSFLRRFKAHDGVVTCVVFAPDGQELATGGEDGLGHVWDPNGTLLMDLLGHKGEVRSLAFSPDGQRLVSGGVDGHVMLWDRTGGPPTPLSAYHTHVMSVDFSTDGHTVASSSWDCAVRLWDLTDESGNETLLAGHTLWVSCIQFSRDRKTLFSAGGDHTIRVWDLATHQERCIMYAHPYNGISCIVLSPDEKVLASSGRDGGIRFWRAPDNPTP